MDDIITYEVSLIYEQKGDYKDTSFYKKTFNKLSIIFERYDCFKTSIDPQSTSGSVNKHHAATAANNPDQVFHRQTHAAASHYNKQSGSGGNEGSFPQRRNGGGGGSTYGTGKYHGSGSRRYANNNSRPKAISTPVEKNVVTTRDCLNKLTKTTYNKMCSKLFWLIDSYNIESTLQMILTTAFRTPAYIDLYVSLIFYIFDRTTDKLVKQCVVRVVNEHMSLMMNSESYVIDEVSNESYDFFCERVKKHNSLLCKTKTMMYFFQNDRLATELHVTVDEYCKTIIDMLKVDDIGTCTYVTIVECLIECFSDNLNEVVFTSLDTIAWKKLIDLKTLDLYELYEFIAHNISVGTSKLKFKCVDLEETIRNYDQS